MKRLKLYKKDLKQKGLKLFIIAHIEKINNNFYYLFNTINLLNRNFKFNNKNYNYLIHKYNYAWKNERTVEVPIIWNEVKKNKNYKILEVGNVLSHYFSIDHDVLDKYEISKRVINQDVTTYNPKKKYDLIVSISTLEHVGWDEYPKEPLKIIKTLENLKSLLNKNGVIIISMPIGYYNPKLNELILEQKLEFTNTYYLKRVTSSNKWTQSNLKEVKNIKYNKPYPNANAILIGYYNKKI